MGVRVREKVEDSGVWWVFISHQGRRTSRKVGDRKAAREAARKIQARLTLGKGAFPEKAKLSTPTLQQYFKSFERSYRATLRPTTWSAYEASMRIHVLPEFGKLCLDEVTRAKMKELVAELVEKGLARDSIRLILAVLGIVYNQAVEDKIVSENPAKRLGTFYRQAPVRHEEITPLTEEESLLFLQETLENERKYYPLFLTALHTGLRSGELAGVQWPDIDWHGKFLEVRRQVVHGEVTSLKTKKGRRRVDLSDDLLETLSNLRRQMQEEAMRKGRNAIPKWVFANHRGSFLDMGNAKRHQFKRVLRKAGLRDIRFHDLRHTFASQLLCNGANILYVSQQLGHSNPQITMKVYSHWIPNDSQREAMNRLPSLNTRLSNAIDNSKTEKVVV
jgi:integrase